VITLSGFHCNSDGIKKKLFSIDNWDQSQKWNYVQWIDHIIKETFQEYQRWRNFFLSPKNIPRKKIELKPIKNAAIKSIRNHIY